MNTRLYQTSDYIELQPWWRGRWGESPSIYALPKSGLIASEEGKDLAAGWIYLDMTTPTALLAFVVTNPACKAKTANLALKTVIGGLIELALSQGRVNLIAACPSGSLSRLFRACGFETRDQNIEHLIIDLKWRRA